MTTTLNPVTPDTLLKRVEQVKEDYVEPPPQRQRGRPRTCSGRAFLPLGVHAAGEKVTLPTSEPFF
jgi:hypothetical protein